ncbi:MAG: homocitrate synthase [Nitrospinae bacterium]|nr:homocitrate synthase [Nitrospinota bacterium]
MIRIVDTTLRDGEQSPGVAFSMKEKITIARMLDEAGVRFIEAGTPAMGHGELAALREISKMGLASQIIMWNRAVEKDIETSLECGAKNIHISLPVSDFMIGRKLGRSRSFVITRLGKTVELAMKGGAVVSIGAEDATRADWEFLVEYAQAARDLGAARLRYCDTVGVMDPFTIHEKVEALAARAGIEIEMHTHNDFGLATANAIAGVKGGAAYVDTTITGIGERAGNAPLEEVVMALQIVMGMETGVDTTHLKNLAEFTAKAAGRALPRSKTIVGEEVFTHESGIHADGVIKDPGIYEPFDPALVGAKRRIVIGKHSGPRMVKRRLAELGFTFGGNTGREVVEKIRAAANMRKGGIPDAELLRMARGAMN